MIKAVLFDKDGVLMDSEAEYERRRQIFFSERGIDASGFPDFYGSNNDVIWRTVEPNDAERRARLAVEFVERFKDEPMIYADYVYPAVRSTLEALRARGILTALASSSPRKFIDRFLDETGLTELFDYTVSGEECENHKPAPDVYLRAMEALGVHPDEVLVVEDSPLGIAAGRAAGAFVLAPSVPSAPGVDQSEADARIVDISGVLNYLDR
ncbi:HAD family hydrolase [Collinsella intestinalis]|jgi:mannitol-1-/sugar-/sorbitol-6-/2-deoxyglucose-6-phosphatase|uniref:HAD family phosphatase n=1 Tax=Collinsella intestinalis TaxID=147207 RepID=A0A414FWL6_9ACTN|nr:HAD family phosphatase [Collinsella intestinalis]RHD55704.1 HAD family phosphatase [Collinsella intestinalis]